MRASSAALLFALLAATAASPFAACANSDETVNDAGTPEATAPADVVQPPVEDAYEPPPLTTHCKDTVEARGIVLAVDGPDDEIRFLTHTGGKLVDNKLAFTGYENPRRVAIRSDGTEAAIAWGGFNTGYGVAFYSMQKDGTTPALVKDLKLGTGMIPFALTYVGDDRLLLAISGGSKHELVTFDRGSAGFAEVARVKAPGNFPYALEGRKKENDAVLARADLANDTASSIHRMITTDAGAFVTTGDVGKTTPPAIDLRVHPSGLFAYSMTDSPEDALTPFHLDATGLLHSVKIEATGVTTLERKTLPRIGNRLAVDPRGRFLVMQGNVYTQGIAQTPQVNSYRLMTAPLGEDGKAGPIFPQSDSITALLIDDMRVAPSGHLLISNHLASQETSLLLFAQPKLGEWELCEALPLIGGAHVGMAPF